MKLKRGHEAAALFQKAVELQSSGSILEAIDVYKRVLEFDDRDFETHNNLGAALHALGHVEDALLHYSCAIELRPASAAPYNNAGIALQARGSFKEAIALHKRAIAIDPRMASAQSNLGHAQQAIGLLEEAVASYRRAIALDPNYADAHGNLGSALREAGQLEEAERHYRRAVELEPRNGRYHRFLATEVSKKPVDRAHFRQMRALADDAGSLSIENRIELAFALAKAYADYGDYERSFEALQEGNRLKRSITQYEEPKTLRVFKALQAMFDTGLIEAMRGCGDPSPVPLFIFGMPRSGTTLVEQILAAHPEVYAAGEFGAIEKALHGFEEICADPSDTRVFAAMLEAQLRKVGARSARQIESLSPSAARVTDKWPFSFLFAGMIHLALPNARMIHVRRDPLDTCFSCYSSLFVGDLPYMYDQGELGRYYRSYEHLMEHWRDVLPASAILEVQYEDIVHDFDSQAHRLIEHCGLEWNDACRDFSSVNRPVRTASAVAVRQPLYQSAIGRAQPYREFLSPLRSELCL